MLNSRYCISLDLGIPPIHTYIFVPIGICVHCCFSFPCITQSQQNASGVTFHTRSDPARSELTFPVGEKQASYQVALTRAENKSYLKKGTDTRP
ncbi:hypothetical protein HBI56_150340 [Parastagonospora nodorum]|uniref:Uncharacterized protein n=1 Tax=Phaeosphaeria nodorum (strain SN15 / ATCC MYA-4574 / FGSC 10173) TaxID=321614 RepID=A0A7U2I6Z4_PHANO|nr:hypothetical protein HBH56_184190 [Parastagonospora nodorum]QRD04084.1 hypothetical protein JI435_128220 [Parastagonospora nodorum SN15]KAH3925998.1 hypothetical protein HBH54_173340 [Parastagonospora nodorum]KAH3944934.1 hypothetical protein HBH53_151600 [Parastagonospora nodorum]KAH3962409.1 hypothetical protein HBH52_224820 [Parastagonospora nodorum]